MTDRELLDLAAWAAGREVWTDIDGNLYTTMNDLIEKPWNPLTDDGDAFRLAVMMEMGIHYEASLVGYDAVDTVEIYHSHDYEFGDCKCVTEPLNGDPYAATRRAVVRAAAEIGRNMK